MDFMKRIPVWLALAFAFTLLSCSPPPFDLGISTSAKTAKRLTIIGKVQIDPNSVNLGSTSSQGSEDIVFIPEKDGAGGITIQAGFISSMDPTSGQQVSFVAYDGSQGRYVRYGSTLPLGPLSSDSYPRNVLQSVKSLHNGIAFQFDDVTPANNQYTIATGNPGTSTFTTSAPISLNSFLNVAPFNGNTKRVSGVSTYPDPSTTLDRSYWLFREQGTENYLETRVDINQFPIVGPVTVLRSTPVLPYDMSSFLPLRTSPDSKRFLYYYDPVSNRSYASWWSTLSSPDQWMTWVWTDAVPTHWQLTGIDHRIDALVTTGELFSTEGNIGRVYDPTTPTGSLEAEFPLSDLRFVEEVYIGGTPTILFTEALWYSRQLYFNVYSIATSQLKTLAQ